MLNQVDQCDALVISFTCLLFFSPAERTADDLEIIYEELLHIKALSHLSTTVSTTVEPCFSPSDYCCRMIFIDAQYFSEMYLKPIRCLIAFAFSRLIYTLPGRHLKKI